MSAGIPVTEAEALPIVDHLFGISGQSAGRVSYLALASILAGSGSIATDLASIRSQVTRGLLAPSSWAELLTLTGSEDAAGAEVPLSDDGTHSQATATGYDGDTVNNHGRFKWSAAWSRWVRIGEFGGAVSDVVVSLSGTANALSGSSDRDHSKAPYAAKFVAQVVDANTGPVSIGIDGGTARALLTNTGAELQAGELLPGMIIEWRWDGTAYRLIPGITVAAMVQRAEDARDGAEEAQLAANLSQIAAALSEGNAATSESNAGASEAAAELARDQAVSAAALAGTTIYEDTAAGIAATSDTQFFLAFQGARTGHWLNNGGVAVLQLWLDQLFVDKRTADAAQHAADTFADGAIFLMDGYFYKVNSGATGTASCCNDLGVDGIVPSGKTLFEHYGATGKGIADDSAAIARAIANGGNIYGNPSSVYFVNVGQFFVAPSNPCRIDWRGAKIITALTPSESPVYEDEATDDAVLNFVGTVATLLDDCYSKNGRWTHTSNNLRVKAHRVIRCKDIEISGHRVVGMQCDFWTHHPDAPMASSGVTRPDVTMDLTNYCNHGGRSANNIGYGDITKDPTVDTMEGVLTRMRWIIGSAVCAHSEANYYKQGFTFRGGASDQDDDGPITSSTGNYTEFWCHVQVIGLKARYIERGGIWSTNAIMQVSECYAYMCGDFGIHNEGGVMVATNCYIIDCASGIGLFSFARWTAYIGCVVELTDVSIWSNSKVFSHVNNITGRTGRGLVEACKFINRDVTDGVINAMATVTLQRDHIWTLEGNQYWNVCLEASGTNHGKRHIENEKFYLLGDASALPPFKMISLGQVVTDGTDYGHVNGCVIDTSEGDLPAGCTGIELYGGSEIYLECARNKIISKTDVPFRHEIEYRDSASGGTKHFDIHGNKLTMGRIHCTSDGFYSARARQRDNTLLNGAGITSAKPVKGLHGTGSQGVYAAPSAGGYEGWICTSAGGAVSGVYDANTTYAQDDCVSVGTNAYWARIVVEDDASGDNGPTGLNGATYWAQFANSLATLKGRGAVEA